MYIAGMGTTYNQRRGRMWLMTGWRRAKDMLVMFSLTTSIVGKLCTSGNQNTYMVGKTGYKGWVAVKGMKDAQRSHLVPVVDPTDWNLTNDRAKGKKPQDRLNGNCKQE
ncbi:hypothetical protein EV401DRAFT_1891478 [Pisolithus croceorrhizus]|nr:hypothetical protein EV401DRAFT_1891478 [Pisolithus croceorrhizus]